MMEISRIDPTPLNLLDFVFWRTTGIVRVLRVELHVTKTAQKRESLPGRSRRRLNLHQHNPWIISEFAVDFLFFPLHKSRPLLIARPSCGSCPQRKIILRISDSKEI